MPAGLPEPEVVYHYTTVDTMMKIVESRSIWATNMDYLNDTTEQEHFLALVRGRLPEFLHERGIKGPYQFDNREVFDLGKWFTPPDERLPLHNLVFVASFSGEPDSLAQWRSYCPDGNGVAIGFSVAELKKARVLDKALKEKDTACYENIEFRAVEYLDKSMIDSIDSAIAEAIELAEAGDFCIGLPVTSEERRHARFNGILRNEACTKKHASFHHENEFRLVVQPTAPPESITLRFRSTGTTLVPFIVVHFEGRFVEDVVVGPTSNMSLSLQAVRTFFAQSTMCPDLTPSVVPFRDVR
jgi:hypothetical protein